MGKLVLAKVAVSKEVDGWEVGVLSDGTPYLTGRSLAKVCGIAVSTQINQSDQWSAGKRDNKLAKMLVEAGVTSEHLYVEVAGPGGRAYAFPDHICMVFLEYYAFEADKPNPTAQANFRTLARYTLREWIYRMTGYDARAAIPESWRHFHDRMLLNVLPPGYFSVFRETADVVIASIRQGLKVDHETVPDISVGKAWSAAWTALGLEAKYGARIYYEHNYPPYFPQADSNPQEAWAYPLAALGEFRRWLADTYLPKKFPGYLKSKVQKGALPQATADKIIAAVAPLLLPASVP